MKWPWWMFLCFSINLQLAVLNARHGSLWAAAFNVLGAVWCAISAIDKGKQEKAGRE